MVNAQEWLDRNYPKENRVQTYVLYIKEQLRGKLDLKEFINLKKIFVSYYINEKEFTIENLPSLENKKVELIKLVNPQIYLQQRYPTQEEREKVKQLNIIHENLEGELDLSDFKNLESLRCEYNKLINLNISECIKLKEIKCPYNQLVNLDCSSLKNLKQLDCSNNYLTKITYPINSKQLTHLNISSNHLLAQDCSVFNQLDNLEILKIGNHDENKINQEIYNHFVGSLEPLKNLNKLKHLNISNTDISSGVEYLPKSLKKIRFSTKERIISKVGKIVWELELFTDKEKQEGWEKLGYFNLEEIRLWVNIGLTVKEYDFANYLKKKKKVNPSELKDRVEELRKEYCEFTTSKQSEEKINNFIKEANLEKIPYEQIENIEYLTEGGFGKIYQAEWNWKNVILKSLNDSQNLTPEFLREVASHKLFDSNAKIVKCYGISREPQTKNYLMVMEYVRGGNLREYLKRNNNSLNIKKKLIQLQTISEGLEGIHSKGIVHKDFHVGNILSNGVATYFDDLVCSITDLGLCRPVNTKNDNEVYGVLPYVAPEVLRNKGYTQASDVYSFGIVAYELFSGYSPYHGFSHDEILGLKICQGLRPDLDNIQVPQVLKDLIKRCWSTDPKQRPTASEILSTLRKWKKEINDPSSLITQQTKEIEEYNKTLSKEVNFPEHKKHEKAVYTSRLLPTSEIIQLLQSSKVDESLHSSLETLECCRVTPTEPNYLGSQEKISTLSLLNMSKEMMNRQKLLKEILIKNDLAKEVFLKQTISNLEEQLILFNQEKSVDHQISDISYQQLVRVKEKSIEKIEEREYWEEIYQLQKSFTILQDELESLYQLQSKSGESICQSEIISCKLSNKLTVEEISVLREQLHSYLQTELQNQLQLAYSKKSGQIAWENWETLEGLENWIKELEQKISQLEIQQQQTYQERSPAYLESKIELPPK
ncbi:MAG: protein kinase [Candidatus Moeniiplasma glomeromycotorum]|nr:protein kinase [Candidatus Moeniiplasma glomeromycotorum]